MTSRWHWHIYKLQRDAADNPLWTLPRRCKCGRLETDFITQHRLQP
jgi:hypothetical protein